MPWDTKYDMRFTSTIKALFSRILTLGGTNRVSNEDIRVFFGNEPQVSYEAILGYAPTRRCVLLLAELMASLTANVYVRTEDGRIKDTNCWANWLLNKEPCPWMSPIQYKTQQFIYRIIHQNSYSYIHRDGQGNPIRFTLLYPWSVERSIDWDTGVPIYNITMPITGKRLVNVPHTDIFHLKGPGDMYEGYNLLNIARQGLGKSLAIENYASKFFQHDAAGRTIVEIPTIAGDGKNKEKAEEFITNYRREYEGPQNSHKTVFVSTGTKITQNQIDADKTQMTQSQQHDLTLCAALFGIPGSYVGALTNTSYGSLEQESRTLLKSMAPMLIEYEQEASKKLLTTAEYSFSRKYVEFNRNELIEIEAEKQHQILLDQYHGGAISYKELREADNRSTKKNLDDGWCLPTTVVPQIETPPQPLGQPQTPSEPNADQKALDLTKGIMERFGERVGKLKQPLSKHRETLLDQLAAWEGAEEFVAGLFEELEAVLPEQRQAIIQSYPLEKLCK